MNVGVGNHIAGFTGINLAYVLFWAPTLFWKNPQRIDQGWAECMSALFHLLIILFFTLNFSWVPSLIGGLIVFFSACWSPGTRAWGWVAFFVRLVHVIPEVNHFKNTRIWMQAEKRYQVLKRFFADIDADGVLCVQRADPQMLRSRNRICQRLPRRRLKTDRALISAASPLHGI
jgi:hypothetical protein